MIDMAARALNLDPAVLEECICLLDKYNPVDVLNAAESLQTHDVATIEALIVGDRLLDGFDRLSEAS